MDFSNKYNKKVSIYTKKNSLNDYLAKDYFRTGFLKWISKKDPTTIHYMYKLMKEFSLDQNKKDDIIRKQYILPRTQSAPHVSRRPKSRYSKNKPILLS